MANQVTHENLFSESRNNVVELIKGKSSKKYEYVETSNGANQFYETQWNAQIFTNGTVGTNEDFFISSVKLKLFRVDTPGIITVSIQNTDAGGKPLGTDLVVNTINADTFTTNTNGEWYEIDFSDYKLKSSGVYAIVVKAPNATGSSRVGWRWINGNIYSGGASCTTTDSGGTWIWNSDYDCLFEIWGSLENVSDPIVSSPAEYRKWIYSREPDVKSSDFKGYPFLIVGPADIDIEKEEGSGNGKHKFVSFSIDIEIRTSDRGYGKNDGNGLSHMDSISNDLMKTFLNTSNRNSLALNSMEFIEPSTGTVETLNVNNELIYRRVITLLFRSRMAISE